MIETDGTPSVHWTRHLRFNAEDDIAAIKDALGRNIFEDWIEGIDLENAFFLRCYYMEQARIIRGVGSPSPQQAPPTGQRVETGAGPLINRRKFHKKFNKMLLTAKRDPVRRWDPRERPILLFLGGRQELPLISGVERSLRKNQLNRLWSLIPNRNHVAPDRYQVVLKNSRENFHREIAALFPNQPIIDLETLSSESIPKPMYQKNLQRWNACVDHLESLSPIQQIHADRLLRALMVVIKSAYQVRCFVRAYNPVCIIGAFEKSPLGALVRPMVRAEVMDGSCAVINVQHGLIPDLPVLDRVEFDRFFVWDRHTRQVITDLGYRPTNTIREVGNHAWDELRKRHRRGADDEAAKELVKWSMGHRLILVCTQPLNRKYRMMFRDILLRYATQRPEVKLLIRPHPCDGAGLKTEWLENVAQQVASRLRLVDIDRLDLAACSIPADVAVSVHSTILHDLNQAGKPVLSITPGADQTSIVRLYDTIPVAIDEHEAFLWLDHLLDRPSAIGRPATTTVFMKSFPREVNRAVRKCTGIYWRR